MATNGINGTSSSIDLAKYQNICEGNDADIEKNISVFAEDVKSFVEDAQASGDGIDENEENLLFNCLHKIDDIVGNLSSSLKTKLGASLKKLFADVINNTMSERFIGNNLVYENKEVTFNDNVQGVAEPTGTDTQQFQPKYPYLDKEADKLIDAEIKRQKEINNSAKAYSPNPYYIKDEIVISFDVINKIKELYKNTVAENGYGVKKFTDVDKIQQLLAWAIEQRSLRKIDDEELRLLTEDAIAALDGMLQGGKQNTTKKAQPSKTHPSKMEQDAEKAYEEYKKRSDEDPFFVDKQPQNKEDTKGVSDKVLIAAHQKIYTNKFFYDMMEVVNPGYKARKKAEQAKR